MSTEYRRGIPSVAHVEAATRLGLEWSEERRSPRRWRFEMRNGELFCDFSSANVDWSESLESLREGSITDYQDAVCRRYRPIRTDGTPVDWEVLDAEAARVVQPATVTPTASAAPMTQPQGFRADLWRRICEIFSGLGQPSAAGRTDWGLSHIASFSPDLVVIHGVRYQQFRQRASADILTRWTVYQELKPLYDLVDGAQGEAAMPRDVEAEFLSVTDRNIAGDRLLIRDDGGLKAARQSARHYVTHAAVGASNLPGRLANFAAVLDAVAEQRVAARQGQTQSAPTVTATQPATPEPRSFADVRPDRHGWRWWRVVSSPRSLTVVDGRFEVQNERFRRFNGVSSRTEEWTTLGRFLSEYIDGKQVTRDYWTDRTVIPTDEQGNPVSWESIGTGQGAGRAGRDVENPELWREAQRQAASSPRTTEAIYQDLLARHRVRMSGGATTFSNSFDQPLTYAGICQVLRDMRAIGNASPKNPTGQPAQPVQPTPLPRFTADELDDVDHSATTTQDSAILKRGKLPTVEALGKYREVMAKRSGTVAEAVKASGIDCEVAQYVLERWASGLSDSETEIICDEAHGAASFTRADIDKRLSRWFAIIRPTLDTSEPADTAAQRQRAEAAERKARMAALQAQLAKERAAREAELVEEPTRFSLLEVDEAADPSKSIEAWKAQRAANERRARNTVRPVTVTSPPPAPKRKPFEVVDAQADGLSGGAAFAVLLSRAMNQNC